MATESSLREHETDVGRFSRANARLTAGLTLAGAGAVFGLGAGILSPLVGSILTAIAWLAGPKWHGFFLQRDGTVLLFLTIPFLIFGAYCLDLVDARIEKYSDGKPAGEKGDHT